MAGINIGQPSPLGSSITKLGVNFSIIATNADFIEILIFEEKNSTHPKCIYRLDEKFRSGPYWHAEIEGLAEILFTHIEFIKRKIILIRIILIKF